MTDIDLESAATARIAALGADELGRRLTGIGLNLLVRDVGRSVRFLEEVLELETVRADRDFALLRFQGELLQLHADHTYGAHPLPGLLPEADVRGAGVELRLYGIDPDRAAARAEAGGWTVLQAPADKPHGLREAFLLDDDGYCWVPGRALPGAPGA